MAAKYFVSSLVFAAAGNRDGFVPCVSECVCVCYVNQKKLKILNVFCAYFCARQFLLLILFIYLFLYVCGEYATHRATATTSL